MPRPHRGVVGVGPASQLDVQSAVSATVKAVAPANDANVRTWFHAAQPLAPRTEGCQHDRTGMLAPFGWLRRRDGCSCLHQTPVSLCWPTKSATTGPAKKWCSTGCSTSCSPPPCGPGSPAPTRSHRPGSQRSTTRAAVRPLNLLTNEPAHEWSVGHLAAAVGVSRATLARRFNDVVGEPPMTFLAGWRLALAADLLREPAASVTSVARQVGYHSPFTFSTAFKRAYGVSPRTHRERTAAPAPFGSANRPEHGRPADATP